MQSNVMKFCSCGEHYCVRGCVWKHVCEYDSFVNVHYQAINKEADTLMYTVSPTKTHLTHMHGKALC